VCALSYFLESQGIMTTGISLVRENTVSMQPPRALWVSFPLGRPLGKPGDAGFQHRVIQATLDLLNRESGPVLEDYPEDAPEVAVSDSPACPVSFRKADDNADTWTTALSAELQTLTPWYELGKRRRNGRTLVGVSGFSMLDNAEKLGVLLDNESLPIEELSWFKHAIEDTKAFYLEALTAQPGDYNQPEIEEVFWRQTRMGAAIIRFNDRFLAHAELAFIARIIVPRRVIKVINTST
jgi:D-proline reductase (dithiol) PrdB